MSSVPIKVKYQTQQLTQQQVQQQKVETQINQLKNKFGNFKLEILDNLTFISFDIKVNEIPLTIQFQLDQQFPQSAPKIRMCRHIQHQLVNIYTQQFNYIDQLGWDQNNLTLIDLANFVQQNLQQDCQQSKIFEEFSIFKQYFDYEKSKDKFLQLKSENIFLNINQKQIDQIQNIKNFEQNLVQTNEYKFLVQCLIEKVKLNQKLLGYLYIMQEHIKQLDINQPNNDDYQKYLEKKSQLSKITEKYEVLKQVIIQQQKQFEQKSIIEKLEEISSQIDQDSTNYSISSNSIAFLKTNQNELQMNFQQNLQQYFLKRQQYHKLQIMKESLQQQF